MKIEHGIFGFHGKMQVAQTKYYTSKSKRLIVAQKFVGGAAFNILKNLRYYQSRGKDLEGIIEAIEQYSKSIFNATDIDMLMGIEGNIRHTYYGGFDIILNDFSMNGRSKQPPKSEVNALVSFGNMMCYTLCLGQIYHTQLNPTISFLHEPGYRRYSLALDLAEIFKPILVDRVIFKVLNKREIQAKDFDVQINSVVLKDAARKTFVRAFEGEITEVKLKELQQRAKNIMEPEEDSLIMFKSRDAKWLEKEIVGKEKNGLDTFL